MSEINYRFYNMTSPDSENGINWARWNVNGAWYSQGTKICLHIKDDSARTVQLKNPATVGGS